MELSKEGAAEIIGHEGIVPFKYLDSVGVPTWMIGHTDLGGVPPKVANLKWQTEYPLAEGIRAFRADMRKFVDRVNKALTVSVPQTAFDALVSFDFNTGRIHNATLTKEINSRDMVGAAAEFDKWHIPPEITGRRNKEKRLFATGKYSNQMKGSLIPVRANNTPDYSKGKAVDLTPVVSDIFAANEADTKADSARNTTVATGGGGAVAGGGSAAPIDPATIDPTTYHWTLLVIGIGLLIAAAYFGYRWLSNRRKAKHLDVKAATFIEDSAAATPAGVVKSVRQTKSKVPRSK